MSHAYTVPSAVDGGCAHLACVRSAAARTLGNVLAQVEERAPAMVEGVMAG